jgi:2-methylcitrate dehydratase PrpD
MDIYIKAYPTCRNIQPPLDGVLDIRRRVNLKPSDVKEVVIRVADYGMGLEHRTKPGSKYIVAQFDLPYCAACAIIDGEVEEKQFMADRIADPEVHKLADKVYVVLDNELNKLYPEDCRPAIVEVKTKDGKLHVSRIDYPKGDPRNTFTDDELFEKFKRWAGPSLSEEQMNKLRKSIFELEKFDDISTFMELLSTK